MAYTPAQVVARGGALTGTWSQEPHALRAVLEPPSLSPQLRAICAACACGDTAPSLRQTLSHPYFTPLQGAQRHDVQLAFQHYITR